MTNNKNFFFNARPSSVKQELSN